MQLNKFTDYALRILMYVSQPKALPHTIAELAQALQVSEKPLDENRTLYGETAVDYYCTRSWRWDSTQSRNPTI